MLYFALKQLTKQTFQDFKVYIYDDGSEDNTKNIVLSFGKRLNITYVKGEKNKGVAFARNELLKLVDTEYFAWQDSDDLSTSDRFEKQIAKIVENKADVCFTYLYFFRHPNTSRRNVAVVDVSKYTSRAGLSNNMGFATGLFKSKLAKIKFNSRLKKKEDVAWMVKLMDKKTKFTCVKEPLYYVRRHPGRLTVNENENNNL